MSELMNDNYNVLFFVYNAPETSAFKKMIVQGVNLFNKNNHLNV